MNDKSFYDIWAQEDQPYDDDQKAILDQARFEGTKYQIMKKVYIVRGFEMFVVHSDDIDVTRNEDGTRRIVIDKGRMVKYTDDGKRKTDDSK